MKKPHKKGKPGTGNSPASAKKQDNYIVSYPGTSVNPAFVNPAFDDLLDDSKIPIITHAWHLLKIDFDQYFPCYSDRCASCQSHICGNFLEVALPEIFENIVRLN